MTYVYIVEKLDAHFMDLAECVITAKVYMKPTEWQALHETCYNLFNVYTHKTIIILILEMKKQARRGQVHCLR